jgi:tetrahydromethanopterin S-methyltransferase subunit G
LPHSRLEQISKAFEMTISELESWHQVPMTNNIHQPQDKFIIVNHGEVKYEAEIPKRLEELEVKLNLQSSLIEEFRQ